MSDRHIGSNFDNFLKAEGLLFEVENTAKERSDRKKNSGALNSASGYTETSDTKIKTMTDVLDTLQSVQFVVDSGGKPTGALLDIDAWEKLLDWIEEQEDMAIARQALTELQNAGGRPKQAKWLSWDAVRDEWDEE